MIQYIYIYILVFWSFLSIHSLKPSLGGMWTIRNRISMDPKSLPYLVWDHLETIWGPFGFTVNQQPEMRSVGDDSLKHHARRDFGQYKQSGRFAARTIQLWKFEPYPVYSIAMKSEDLFKPHASLAWRGYSPAFMLSGLMRTNAFCSVRTSPSTQAILQTLMWDDVSQNLSHTDPQIDSNFQS